jgi:hypothetical protein
VDHRIELVVDRLDPPYRLGDELDRGALAAPD